MTIFQRLTIYLLWSILQHMRGGISSGDVDIFNAYENDVKSWLRGKGR